MSSLPSSQQRDSVKIMSPPWLQSGNGEKFMYLFGLSADVILEKLNQAMRAHMPGLGTETALPYLGNDKVLVQGPVETNDAFIARLSGAYDAWQTAGNRRAVMFEALNYVAEYEDNSTTGQVPRCVIVSTSSVGTWATWDSFYNTSDLSGSPAHVSITSANWNWDNKWRWWWAYLVLFFESGASIGVAPFKIGDPGITIGGRPDASFGLNAPPGTFNVFRSLIRKWKSANTFYPWFILCFNGGDSSAGNKFSPNSAQGSGNPDGTWGRWSKVVNGCRVPSRASDARYVDGIGIYQKCFEPTGI